MLAWFWCLLAGHRWREFGYIRMDYTVKIKHVCVRCHQFRDQEVPWRGR